MPRTRHSRHIFALFPSLQEAILPGLCFTKFRLNNLSIYYLHLFLFPQLGHLRAVCCRQLPLSNSQGKAHGHYFIDFFLLTDIFTYVCTYIKQYFSLCMRSDYESIIRTYLVSCILWLFQSSYSPTGRTLDEVWGASSGAPSSVICHRQWGPGRTTLNQHQQRETIMNKLTTVIEQ